MNLRSGRVLQPPEESASNDPRSLPSVGTGPSLESHSGAQTNLRRVFSESSLSSDTMSAYEEGDNTKTGAPTTSLLDRFSNFIGIGNTSADAPRDPPIDEEVNSFLAKEDMSRPSHIEIAVPPPAIDEEISLATNGMTQAEIQQIEDARQLARQLEAEATLRGQQRLIERQTKAKIIADKGKAKVEDLPADARVFHTLNWAYATQTQTLFDKVTNYSYPVPWADLREHAAAATTYIEFKQMLGDCLNQIMQ